MKASAATLTLFLLLGWLLPFWGVAAIAFGAFAYWHNRSLWQDFGWAFLAGVLAWGLPATYLYLYSQGKLPARISHLLSLPHPILTLIITVLLGGILTSFAGVSGAALRAALKKEVT